MQTKVTTRLGLALLLGVSTATADETAFSALSVGWTATQDGQDITLNVDVLFAISEASDGIALDTDAFTLEWPLSAYAEATESVNPCYNIALPGSCFLGTGEVAKVAKVTKAGKKPKKDKDKDKDKNKNGGKGFSVLDPIGCGMRLTLETDESNEALDIEFTDTMDAVVTLRPQNIKTETGTVEGYALSMKIAFEDIRESRNPPMLPLLGSADGVRVIVGDDSGMALPGALLSRGEIRE